MGIIPTIRRNVYITRLKKSSFLMSVYTDPQVETDIQEKTFWILSLVKGGSLYIASLRGN